MLGDGRTGESGYTHQQLRTYRRVLWSGAVINLVFWTARQLAGLGAGDPLWQRLLLSGSCALVGWAALGPPAARARVSWGLNAIVYLGTVWWVHRVAASGLRPDFAVGLFIPPAIISVAIRRPDGHLRYAVFAVLAAAIRFWFVPAPVVSPVLIVSCLAVMLVMMHLQIRTRMRAAEALTEGEEMREQMTEHTTDAMLLVDPDGRVALQGNARARAMFGVAPGAAIGPYAGAALGKATLEPAEVASIATAIARDGVYHARPVCRLADGEPFTADVAIRPIRYGRRTIWLVRLTASPGPAPVASPDRRDRPRTSADEYRPEEVRMYRRVLLIAPVLMVAMWFVRRSLGLTPEPLWQRLVLGAACLLVAAVSAGPPWIRRHFATGINLLAFGASAWWVYRVAQSGLRPDYAVGLMVVPTSIGLAFHRPVAHLAYAIALVAMAAAAFLPLPAPVISPAFVLLSLTFLLGLSHFILRGRLRAYDELLASDDLRDVLFEHTSDALVLVDPISRTALDCNDRARVLFGRPAAPLGDLSVEELVGIPGLGTVDVVHIIKEIGERGQFRRVRQYAGPGYRAFTGDLAILPVKRHQRNLWLVRVADCSAAAAASSLPDPSLN